LKIMTAYPSATLFGGSGFVGRHIVRRLARQGGLIRVPTRNMGKAMALKTAGAVGQIVPFPCSTRSDAEVARAVAGADTVMNLLGILYERGSSTFQNIHVETAARIARLARENGVKNFVHLSALGADAASKSKYARSKAAGEAAIRAFFPEAVILRPGVIFGPEDRFLNLFASLARFTPILPLIGGGRTKFQPVYAGDVADAVMAALADPDARGKTFELGGPGVYSFRELLDIMLREVNRKRWLAPLPWGIAKLQAAFLELLPSPLLTRDQVELLKTDNIIRDPSALTLRDLGVTPTALELILPTTLDRFRKGGRLGV
jgi:NADH dehydrogenase